MWMGNLPFLNQLMEGTTTELTYWFVRCTSGRQPEALRLAYKERKPQESRCAGENAKKRKKPPSGFLFLTLFPQLSPTDAGMDLTVSQTGE